MYAIPKWSSVCNVDQFITQKTHQAAPRLPGINNRTSLEIISRFRSILHQINLI